MLQPQILWWSLLQSTREALKQPSARWLWWQRAVTALPARLCNAHTERNIPSALCQVTYSLIYCNFCPFLWDMVKTSIC